MLRLKSATFGFVAILLVGNWQESIDDPASLQGEWEVVSVVRQGFPDSVPVGHTVRFVDNEVHFEATDVLLNNRHSFHDGNLRIPS